MADLPITLTCADYIRVLPIAAGLIPTPGMKITMALGKNGAWIDRAEALRRATGDATVTGGEGSMGLHLYRIDKGDRSHVGLPIYPLRNFGGRDFYVKKGSPLKGLKDLAGKRVGIYSVTASGSIWYRHFLRWAGVEPTSVEWIVGNVDSPWGSVSTAMPPGTKVAPADRSMSEMLIAGELDAIAVPPRPKDFHPTRGPIVRLLDFEKEEAAYYRDTGCFCPQHLITIRREVWEANRWVARALTDAFIACEAMYTTMQRSFPYTTPWAEAEVERTVAVMGEAYHPHGIEQSRRELDAFCGEAHKLGLTSRRITVEEYFQEYLAS